MERTISGERAPLSLPATSSGPKSNPFGSAKPIDTASKLQELEARIAERKVRGTQAQDPLLSAATVGITPPADPANYAWLACACLLLVTLSGSKDPT